jgi:hypothetical protein
MPFVFVSCFIGGFASYVKSCEFAAATVLETKRDVDAVDPGVAFVECVPGVNDPPPEEHAAKNEATRASAATLWEECMQ